MLLRLCLVALMTTLIMTVAATGAAAAPPSPASVERAADELSERLVSPCCWRGTLRSHTSPLAHELRAELRTRLAGGESAAAIEADLVKRYGPRVRAFSPDWDPRSTAGLIALVVIVGGLALLVLRVGRQRRRAVPTAPPAPIDRRLEEALDDELLASDV